MSVIYPGSSINFDAAALRQNEDEEMQEEELRQQKELQELLSAELSDDLLDDDRSSVNDSHRSLPHDASPSRRDADHDPVEGWLHTTQGNENYNNQQDNQSQYYQSQMNDYNYNNGQMNPYRPDHYNHHPQQYVNYDNPYPGMPSHVKQWQPHGFASGTPFHQQRNDGVGQYVEFDNGQENVEERYEDSPDQYPFSERGEVEGREDYGGVIDRHQMQQYLQYKPQPAPASSSTLSISPASKLSYRQSFSPHSSLHERQNKQQRFLHDAPYSNMQGDYDTGKMENSFQKQFNNVTQDAREEGSRQMAQLQILYKARGKRIDELTGELDELKKDSAREKRILSHQLAMTKDQKDGICTSLEESQALVQVRDRIVEELKGKIEAQQADIESLKSVKNELMNKLQVSERTVESLHEQLSQMNHSDAIERARDQHDAVLNAANDRHELQVLELTTQLDDLRQQNTDMNDELEKIRFQLNKVMRESEQTLLDKTETINRLTKSLEEAQNQCQGLLAGSSNNTFSHLQYADVMKEKKENEEEIALLRMRLHDAEEHLKLFENAMQLGALGKQTRSGNLSESFRELMNVTKKLDWSTPQTENKEYEPGSREELIDGLRRELERALACNKSKRDQVTKIQQQCNELEQELVHWRSRADEAQAQLKLHTCRDMKHDENLTHNLQELEERAEAAEDEVSRLEKVCIETKHRMAEMIQQHDQDKQDAVDRCERACMQLHSDAKQVLRDELTAANEQKIYELTVDHDGKIRELNDLIGQLQSELHDVKQSYVHVCAEKDSIPESLRLELLREFEQEKAVVISEHKNEMLEFEKKICEEQEELREQLKQEHEKMLKDSREEWEEEREKDFAQQIETKIALAKINWFEEYTNSKQQAIQDAAKETEDRWKAKIESLKQEWVKDKATEIQGAVGKEKESWIAEKDAELEALRDELQKEKEAAVKTASSIAELNMAYQRQSIEGQNQEAIESKLKEAYDAWKEEQEGIMESARSLWQQEQKKALYEAEKESERKIERLRKEQQTTVEKAVAELRKKCDHEHQTALKQKSVQMEKEIAKLQEQHRREYEMFVEDNKKTLSSFLEKEKSRACVLTKDAALQVQVQNPDYDKLKYEMEKNQLSQQFRNEMNQLEHKHNTRCEELDNEIRVLVSTKNDLVAELQRFESKSELDVERAVLSSQHELSRMKLENERIQGDLESSASKIQAMTQQNKDDVNRLKERMRDEYRRWKKERSSLVARLKDTMQRPEQQERNSETPGASSNCKLCQSCAEGNSRLLQHKDEASKKAFSELSDMYVETLAMIKSEVMSFLGESRGRTRDTLSQERKRVTARVRSHYVKVLNKIKPERDVDAQLSAKPQSLGSDSGQGNSTPMLSSEREHSLERRGRQMPPTTLYERRLAADQLVQCRGTSHDIPVRMIPDRDVGTPGVASEPRYRAPYRSHPVHHSLTRITTRERPLHDEDRLSEGHGSYSSSNLRSAWSNDAVRSNLLSDFQGCENVPQRVRSANEITGRLYANSLPRVVRSPR